MERSEFRVEKGRTEATLVLANGSTVRGIFFVSATSATRSGPERIKDVLNSEPGFFPFEIQDALAIKTVLYHRDHVVMVTLSNNNEPSTDPGYEVATPRVVSMLLTNGQRLTGAVRVFRPVGRDRLSDYARTNERFRYLEGPDATMIVNSSHVIELTEVSQDA
ncbi:MAG TPA: hypothetical protein VNJ02_20255 [Vicinamibacterales bacterium]|nr:hypothetical protein [Vicinamibacterales bacterium]